MKKTILSLAIALSCYSSYAQTYLPLTAGSGSPLSGTLFTTSTEALRVNQSSAYLCGYDNSGTTRTGYLQFNSGSSVVLTAENAPNLLLFGSKIGLSTSFPQAKFHIVDVGTSSNAPNQYSGNLIIQANSSGRASTSGASLEFVIPANTDGSNPWGQARIITVAGNGNTSDATGKMILGTRRMFDKGVGTGLTWNYGDDLVIDGSGNIGINTLNPNGYKLAVNGTIHTEEIKVDMNGWNDAVFDKTYPLPTLSSIKTYIDQNHHLPEIQSEAEVIKNGINVGQMLKLQTKKIEELTLYLIDKDKQLSEQNSKIAEQQKQINVLKQEAEDNQNSKEQQERRIATLEAAMLKLTNKKN